ncbi:ribosomal protein S18-alanine N-acetyltransferase [Pasteurellaceae bacterium 20609_3]|uniref:ribosomal protein S18-alanine N-acetyltransferase n=1 Tax=Spirabiliibacterium mucosae TaxID=28156 RepID=UPI001AAC65AC|nr:ribosomal protein S18-alanine N-acetyltransferase [Spirabiliibacterium mucosae]MBE2898288.1 ribosomal protein S18-alanine N-acetyltransferase [Spirabiliibacterium mucosae]
MTISPVTQADFTALYAIECAAHAVPWSYGTLCNNQGERYCNLKITHQGHIAGFAICQVVLDEATLFNLAIAPEYQRQGLGKALLSALMESLRAQGVATLWLEVRQSNQRAQRLYDTLGFNEVSLRKNYYPTPDGGREHAVIMAAYL